MEIEQDGMMGGGGESLSDKAMVEQEPSGLAKRRSLVVLTGMLLGDWWARAVFSELKKEKGEEMEAGILKTTPCNFIIQGSKKLGNS